MNDREHLKSLEEKYSCLLEEREKLKDADLVKRLIKDKEADNKRLMEEIKDYENGNNFNNDMLLVLPLAVVTGLALVVIIVLVICK